jgi:hypothetical protein
MTALTEFLFPAPARRTTLGILGWWEKRRLAYNVMVGGAGMITVTVATVAGLVFGQGAQIVPWQPVVVFGVGANLFYFLGPAVEIVLEKVWGRELLPVGPALYRMGLTFAVGLALFPSLLILVAMVLRVVGILPV